MNIQRYFLAVIVSFIVMGFAGFGGSVIFAEQLSSFIAISRGMEGNAVLMPYSMLGYLIITAIFTYIYIVGRDAGKIAEGLKFGAMFGVMMSGISLINYSILPIEISAMVADMIINIVVYTIGGVVIAMLYKPKVE